MSAIEDLGLPALPEPLPRPVIDNHTHLTSTEAYSGLPVAENLALAAQVGVTRIVEVGCDVPSARYAVDLVTREPSVRAAIALHPNDVARTLLKHGEQALEDALTEIGELVQRPGVIAVGETGLDYFRTRDDEGRLAQDFAFRRHIRWAKLLDKTLVIHDRDAHDDILRVLDSEGVPERFVMHCFSGDADFAASCLERGAWLSFPGVVTFGTADALREAALATPLDRILVETDAPYLTPKPQRGKANAPYLLPHTVRFLAELFQVELAEFCDQVTENTFAAYGGRWGDE
ncbi:MAG: TatD family hydrolase [Propionibacteriaceae bacterium]|nr:TatD family hydrolase [Propionibacteriaceae bacterium]